MTTPRADYLLGMLAGIGTGLGIAMIFVEPYLITPENTWARGGVFLGGMVVAVVVENVFNRKRRRRDREKQAPS